MSSPDTPPFDDPAAPSSPSPASNEENAETQSSPEVDTDSTEPSIPPQSIPPTFVFRTNIRNIYINPITNLTSIPPPIENNNKPEEYPKWDEVCFQWCKQQDKSRRQGSKPTCRMLCLRRVNAKSELIKRKIIESEERILHDKHQLNVARVLYGKGEGQEAEERLKGPRNFLDGYYIYYLNGLDGCQKHTEDMKSEDLMNRAPWPQTKPEEREIDLGEQLEKTKAETKRIVKRAFTPGFQLGKKYIESWSDGTQVAFFKRFYESAQRLDAVHMVRDNVKKVIDVWVKGGGGGGGGNDNGFGGGESNNNNNNSTNEQADDKKN